MPLLNGSGMSGIIVAFKECLHHDIMPFIIDEEHKMFHYCSLKAYESEKEFLTDTCLSGQDQHMALVAYIFAELSQEGPELAQS